LANTLSQFLAAYFGADVATDNPETDVTIGTTAVLIIQNNPRTVRLEISNTGPTAVTLGRSNQVTLTTGDPLAPGETWEINWLFGLDSVGDAIFGISGGAGGSVHVRQTLMI
jgi:hypothetical protein